MEDLQTYKNTFRVDEDTLGVEAQEVDKIINDLTDDFTIDLSKYYNMANTYSINPGVSGNWGNITISNSGSNYASNYSYSTITTGSNNGLHVSGDASFDGDVKIKGRSISESLEAIEKRLGILVPDPKKLEHFEALKKAYDQYKVLEALCQLPEKKDEDA